MNKLKERIIKFINNIKEDCKDYRTFCILIFVMLIVHTPIWGGLLCYKLFSAKWGLAMATTMSLFWLGPFTPFFPICIGLTYAIKRLINRKDMKK